ncbi:hypothetical protein ACCI51_10560 [Microbulbifer echini]|uniref:Uncharacterized protein n=1 Tax=Microbulbifer echini TaxID=1529067 RepID=A0ABV4NNK0_9GAMM|nr:hypothetical protein [uncultured Microbulbifer sp.]
MYSSFALFALLSTATSQNTCTDGIALAKGVAAIFGEYPWYSHHEKDYVIRNYPKMYLVVPKKLNESLKAGGIPKATINKENCQVINVYLAR